MLKFKLHICRARYGKSALSNYMVLLSDDAGGP